MIIYPKGLGKLPLSIFKYNVESRWYMPIIIGELSFPPDEAN
jgi:hypothetical protein